MNDTNYVASQGTFKNKVCHEFWLFQANGTMGERQRGVINQSQGQGKAAAILQRDWRNGEDPDRLPFATNITRHALIRLVHKGLRYYEHEQAVIQKQVRS